MVIIWVKYSTVLYPYYDPIQHNRDVSSEKPVYVGLFANTVSVLLPLITGQMEWALTCLSVISYYKRNSHGPSICTKVILLNHVC